MAKKNEAYIEFKAKTDGFQKGIKDMNSQLKTASNELRLNSTEMKGAGESAKLLSDRQAILQKELQASAQKVALTEQSLAECKATLGENSKEYQSLSNAVLVAKNQQAAIQNELNATTQKLTALESENKRAVSSFGQLTDKIDKQESELDSLKKAYAEAALSKGKDSDEAKALGKQIESLSGELSENKKKINEAEKAADKFDKTLEDTEKKSLSLKDNLGKLALGFTALVAGAEKAGKAAIDAFNEVDEGADNVIRATGATGAAAEELEASYKNVATSIVGDFGEIGSTLGEVNTRFEFTGSEAEAATEKFLKFADVTGIDAVTAVQDVSRAIESSGLKSKDYSNILDSLTKAGQATGISVDKLAAALTDNGAVMREMDFNTNETIALLSQFEVSGVNSQTVVRGMQKAIVTWGKEGKNAKEEFSKMVEGIQNGSVTAGEAYTVFGTKAGVELVDAIKSGRFEYEKMLGVVNDSKGTLETTFDDTIDGGYKLEQAAQNAKVALADVGEVVGDAITPVVETFGSKVLPAVTEGIKGIQDAWQWIKDNKASVIVGVTGLAAGFAILEGAQIAAKAAAVKATVATSIQTATQWLLNAALNANPIGIVVMAIAALVAGFIYLWNNCEGFRNFFINMWEKIKSAFSAVVEWFRGAIESVKSFFTGLWEGVKNVFETIKNGIKVALMFIVELIKGYFNLITLPFRLIWENCGDKVIAIFNKIKEFISSVLEKIKEVVLKGFNLVKEHIINPIIEAKDKAVETFNAIKEKISEKINQVKEKVTTVFNAVKEKISAPIQAAKNKVNEVFTAIKDSIASKIEAIKSKVTTIFNAVKTAIETPINKAKETVKKGIDAIKGFFDKLKIKFPNIKLPHFSIAGKFSLSPPSVPKLKIDWYAKGAAFTAPTIVPTLSGLKGFGEAGREYALPLNERSLTPLANLLNKLQFSGGSADYIANRVDSAIDRLANRLSRLEAAFYVDGERLATATAVYDDNISGERAQLEDRGLAV